MIAIHNWKIASQSDQNDVQLKKRAIYLTYLSLLRLSDKRVHVVFKMIYWTVSWKFFSKKVKSQTNDITQVWRQTTFFTLSTFWQQQQLKQNKMFQVQFQFHFIKFSHIFIGIATLNEKQDNGAEVNENEPDDSFVRCCSVDLKES